MSNGYVGGLQSLWLNDDTRHFSSFSTKSPWTLLTSPSEAHCKYKDAELHYLVLINECCYLRFEVWNFSGDVGNNSKFKIQTMKNTCLYIFVLGNKCNLPLSFMQRTFPVSSKIQLVFFLFSISQLHSWLYSYEQNYYLVFRELWVEEILVILFFLFLSSFR